MSEELKPCSYCGGTFSIVKTIRETYNLTHDKKGSCPVSRATEYYSEYEAIVKMVNARPVEDALAARVKELEQGLNLIRGVARNKMNPQADKAVIVGIANDLLHDDKREVEEK